jgi:hypothetical protein
LVDLLSPTTDTGVMAQLIVVLAVGGPATFGLRRHREARVLAMGATLLLLGLIGLRAIH